MIDNVTLVYHHICLSTQLFIITLVYHYVSLSS